MSAAPAIERHAPGTFCWVELATTDPDAAKNFYTSLFGWTFADLPGPDGVYTTWKVHGLEHGAMHTALPEGVPPHWLLYIAVTSVDASIAKARGAGATVLMEPTDVMDYGRMAVIRDPAEAVVALWQARKHIGARIINTTATLCWSELVVRDTRAATEFYTKLFGWRADTKKAVLPEEQTDYTEWVIAGNHIGGMLPMTEEWGDAPPHWMAYFQVTDCAESVDKAKKLGGHVEFGPLPIEDVGRFALIRDPQGAYFSIIELNLVA
jgi:predicted enzyme related to lactoylglutathione lyase